MKSTFRVLATLLALALPAALAAQSLPAPQGPVILTLRGNLAHTNVDGTAQFDLAMLDALDQRQTVTETPWHEGVQTFTGPLISSILTAAGATGAELRIVAINDYAASMPVQDTGDHAVILASRRNGETMSVRETGPLFVIYPFDEDPSLRDEVYFSRSVWQVHMIEVLP